jgi:phosphatidylglycerophosphate synthase
MELHRVTSTPDWVKRSAADYNRWQAIAARTHGILTPGNIVTIAGVILSVLGLDALLRHDYWGAAALLATGRLGDIVDGWAAERTGTKSPLGELLDAASDKLVTVLAVVTFVVTRVTFLWLLVALLLPHIVIALIAAIAKERHKRIHPSRIGKLSMAVAWCSLLGLVLTRATHSSRTGDFSLVVYGVGLLSIGLGCSAAYGYIRKQSRKT